MSVKIVVAMCLVTLCLGEDFKNWKENKLEMMVATRERKMYEGVAGSLDDCLNEADTLAGGMVQFHNALNVCTIYVKAVKTENLQNTTDYALYTKSEDEGKSDDSMTTGGLVATIILAIVFTALLVFCAINCQEEEHSIAAQIENLEKKEMEIEEAVSEALERESQAEEMREMEAAKKEEH
eukprot:TRINITY_DN1907_c0_g1_i2.p1 TRINITY_DN1907_c0_g1~~TRINITY_DN1907_c0_g1_i2.p1  ORF type:complete len:181 (+),score=93.04 TRINITY_DN1907_c0_g1_i2:94-636(+)